MKSPPRSNKESQVTDHESSICLLWPCLFLLPWKQRQELRPGCHDQMNQHRKTALSQNPPISPCLFNKKDPASPHTQYAGMKMVGLGRGNMNDRGGPTCKKLVASVVQANCIGTRSWHELWPTSSSIPSCRCRAKTVLQTVEKKRRKHAVVSSREANKVFREHEQPIPHHLSSWGRCMGWQCKTIGISQIALPVLMQWRMTKRNSANACWKIQEKKIINQKTRDFDATNYKTRGSITAGGWYRIKR